ncbi:MAG: winged helix-turn-helix domain-containing protein, partial [Bdellovibrionaceae bacterium]|nr:winged helix-turn-helix domain-containing protein [Pseudobdellovibrionaceae bacterium]
MVKTEELVDKIHGFDFLASYKVERDPRIKIKLLALHHLQNGKSIQDVSEITLYNSKSVKSWLENFIAFDYEGLIEREGRGRKPRLPCEEEESFKTELCKMQDSKPGGSLGATEIRTMLADQFDCCYSRSGTYALLDRLNLVWITGRSKHPKSSQEAIE